MFFFLIIPLFIQPALSYTCGVASKKQTRGIMTSAILTITLTHNYKEFLIMNMIQATCTSPVHDLSTHLYHVPSPPHLSTSSFLSASKKPKCVVMCATCHDVCSLWKSKIFCKTL